jgi:hypothetical protein
LDSYCRFYSANSLSIVRHRQLQNTTEPLGYICRPVINIIE